MENQDGTYPSTNVSPQSVLPQLFAWVISSLGDGFAAKEVILCVNTKPRSTLGATPRQPPPKTETFLAKHRRLDARAPDPGISGKQDSGIYMPPHADYPIEWLDSTFTTRSKTESLLRPDLESGLITQRDFNLASSFLPGYHRYWPVGYGSLSGMAVAAGGRRWPHMKNKVVFISFTAGVFGAIYGQIKRAKAHWNFTQQLENPTGFLQALENVNIRTGGTKSLGWTIPGAERKAAAEQSSGNDSGMVQESQESERWHSSERAAVAAGEAPSQSMSTQAPNQTPPVPQEPTTSRPATRWDEIRMANARGSAKDSSWEALRQSHERDRVSEASPSPPDNYDNNQQQQRIQHQPSGTLRDQERTKEQAKFDALLEAERKMSRG